MGLYIVERDGLPTLIGNLGLENIQFKIPLPCEAQ